MTSGGGISNSYAKVNNMEVAKGVDVCNSAGKLIDKLVGTNYSSVIIESNMAGGCERPPLFDQ